MYDRYGEEVEFFMVYIREAHPTDGRQSRANARDGIFVVQPRSIHQRLAVANHMCSTMRLSLPAIVDAMDDLVSQSYNALPDRLYLIGRDGRIAYQGEHGPRGFRPAELEDAIQEELD